MSGAGDLVLWVRLSNPGACIRAETTALASSIRAERVTEEGARACARSASRKACSLAWSSWSVSAAPVAAARLEGLRAAVNEWRANKQITGEHCTAIRLFVSHSLTVYHGIGY